GAAQPPFGGTRGPTRNSATIPAPVHHRHRPGPPRRSSEQSEQLGPEHLSEPVRPTRDRGRGGGEPENRRGSAVRSAVIVELAEHSGVTHRRAGQSLPSPEGPIANGHGLDRKSTRLNSSHVSISYAVLCLTKHII